MLDTSSVLRPCSRAHDNAAATTPHARSPWAAYVSASHIQTWRSDRRCGASVLRSTKPGNRRASRSPPRAPGHSLARRPFFRRPTTVRVGGSAARRPVITTSASDEASGHHHRPPSVLRWCSSPGVHPRGDISIHKGIYRSTCKWLSSVYLQFLCVRVTSPHDHQNKWCYFLIRVSRIKK